MLRLLSNNIPTYILGVFNGRHTSFGHRDNNTVGKSLINLINQGKLIHLGPHFPTYFSRNSSTNPDKIFSNKHHYLNSYIEPGNITASDHLPILFTLSTKPIYIKQQPRLNMKQANWEAFRQTLNDKTIPINIENI